MGDIYSTARNVVGWLGPDFETEMAFVNTCMRAYIRTGDASDLSATVNLGSKAARADHIIATVVPLFIGAEFPDPSQKPYNYWHRVWTAQEIVKAKRVILQSGLAELPLDWLQEFHEYFASTISPDNHHLFSRVSGATTIDTTPGNASAPLLDVLIRLGLPPLCLIWACFCWIQSGTTLQLDKERQLGI